MTWVGKVDETCYQELKKATVCKLKRNKPKNKVGTLYQNKHQRECVILLLKNFPPKSSVKHFGKLNILLQKS